MFDFKLIIRVLCLGFLSLSAGSSAEDFFRCNFSRIEGQSNGQPAAPSYYNHVKDHLSVTGGGNTSRAAIFAMENLQDFQPVARMPLKHPLPAIVYTGLKKFPSEKGYCELWIAPYFNQKQAWRKTERRDFSLNYILSLYQHTPGTPLAKRADKSVIALYLQNRRVGARFVFSDGSSTTLSLPVEKWVKRSWHKITLCWEPGRQRLYIDRKLAGESQKSGTLADFNALELGGRDYNVSFQGLIDDIVIASGKPLDTAPYGFEGDRKTFPEIAIPEPVFRNWKPERPKSALSVASEQNCPLFCYAGGSEYPLYANMVQSVPVRGGTHIRTDLVVRKTGWNGSRAMFFLEFLDAAGKMISRRKIDSNTLGPVYRPMSLSELSSSCGLNCDIAYFNYFKIPPKCRSLRLAASLSGNPAKLMLKKWSLRLVDPSLEPWFQQPVRGKQLTYEKSPAASDDEIRRMLKKRKPAVSRLVRSGDRLEWQIDGKKIAPVILWNPIIGSFARLTEFRPAGFQLSTSTVFLGHSPYIDDYDQIWLDNGSFDLKAMEKAVFKVLREAPDAYVILNIFVCPTAKWLKENRSELQLAADGNPVIMRSCAVTTRSSARFPEKRGESWTASIHSEKYRKDLAAVLEKLFREFEKTDAAKAVAGVYVTGGDDAQFRAPPGPDMSPLTRPAFQKFLREKYGTQEKLSAAWKQNIVAWQDIKVPAKTQIEPSRKTVYSEAGPCPESDYKEFVSCECMKVKKAFRAAVKKGAPRLLVGGYDNAMALAGSGFYGRGRSNLAELIQDPFCDFLISLPAYGRERDECLFPIGLKAYTGSMRLHKKLIITELDIRNPKQPPLVERNYRSHNWQATHDYRTFGDVLKLCAGYSAAWGGMFHACVMGRFWYDTPEAVAAWQQAADIMIAAPGEKLADDRIAWICGEKFCNFFCRNASGEMTSEIWSRNVSHALWMSQIRFDAYLPGDLWHPDFKAPKVMLLTCLASMKPEELSKIRRHFLKDGRILIWLGTPSVFSGAGLKDISAALGFRLSQPEEIQKRTIFVAGENDPILKNVTGFLYNPREDAPVIHFGNVAVNPLPGDKVLARYQGTGHPGMVLRKTAAGTEIFIGQPGAVTPKLLQNIAQTAGIRPVTDGGDLVFRGGGLIVIGASTGNGIRRIHYPEGVKALECLTGQKILHRGTGFLEVSLKYGECAVFRHQTAGK